MKSFYSLIDIVNRLRLKRRSLKCAEPISLLSPAPNSEDSHPVAGFGVQFNLALELGAGIVRADCPRRLRVFNKIISNLLAFTELSRNASSWTNLASPLALSYTEIMEIDFPSKIAHGMFFVFELESLHCGMFSHKGSSYLAPSSLGWNRRWDLTRSSVPSCTLGS
jgi:hypothetical protein